MTVERPEPSRYKLINCHQAMCNRNCESEKTESTPRGVVPENIVLLLRH